MELTVHRGTREIGGSCVEVRSGTTRLILDVGLPLVDANRNPFDSVKALRSPRDELIATGTIPPVPGLFAGDAEPPDAILLTHAHLDHSGLIHHTRPAVPVYATRGTSKMMLAGAVFANRPPLDRSRHRPVSSGVPFRVGDVTVTPFAVDHSTFACVAYLLEAEGRTLFYSGDLRRHGRKPGMIRTLVEQVAPKNIDVLLMEGTHVGGDNGQGISEFGLEEEVVELARTAPALVLAAFSPQDVDRLVTIYRAAGRTDRVLVADAYAAFVLHLVAGEAQIPRPSRHKGIRVYHNAAFRRRNIENLTRLFDPDRVELDEILAAPEKHLMAFRPSMAALDFGGRIPARSRVIFSYWKGYLANPDWIELQKQVADVDGDFVPAHASGHIYVADSVELVKALNPKTVIPIHTFEPQLFPGYFPNTVLASDGQQYVIR
jgi:ribonuclease J